MPELGVGQHHAGKEGAERGRKPDHEHQRGDGDHDHQRERGVDLAQPGAVHMGIERPDEVVPREHGRHHGPERHQRDAPAGQAFDEGCGDGVLALRLGDCPGARQGQKRQEG